MIVIEKIKSREDNRVSVTSEYNDWTQFIWSQEKADDCLYFYFFTNLIKKTKPTEKIIEPDISTES